MAFSQFKLDRSVLQTRGIFNKYVYDTDDTIEQVLSANYFAQSRFAETDNDETNGMGWNGGVIDCSCSNGFFTGQMDGTGTLSNVSGTSSINTDETYIPLATSNGILGNSSMTEDETQITSTKPIQVPDGGALKVGATLDIFTSGEEIGFQDLVSGEKVNSPYRTYTIAGGTAEAINVNRRAPSMWEILQPTDTDTLTLTGANTQEASFTTLDPAYVAGYRIRGTAGKPRIQLLTEDFDGNDVEILDTLGQGIELDFANGDADGQISFFVGLGGGSIPTYELGFRTGQVTKIILSSADGNSVTFKGLNNPDPANFLLYFQADRSSRFIDVLYPVDDTSVDNFKTLSAFEIDQRIADSANSVQIETLFTGRSVALAQNPTGLDIPLQVEFGPAQLGVTDPVQLNLDGSITANEANVYSFNITLPAGRTGAAGVSFLYGRALINGVQGGSSVLIELDNANVIIPMQFSLDVPMEIADVLTVEVLRDSSGNDSGGLVSGDPVLVGWNNSASAAVTVTRMIPVSTDIPPVGPTLSRYVLVKTKNDFPAPASGIITLDFNTNYEINGTIDLTGDRIQCNGSNKIFGINPRTDVLLTDNAVSLIAAQDAGFIGDNIGLSNPSGLVFQFQDTVVNTNNLFLRGCVVAGFQKLASCQNLLLVDIEKCGFQDGNDGISFDGTFSEGVRITGNVIEDTVQGTLVDLGTSTFGALSLDHNFVKSNAGLVFLSGLADSGNIPIGSQASVISNITFGGNTPAIVGVSFTDLRYDFQINNTIPDSSPIGSMYAQDNNSTTSINFVSVPVLMNVSTTAGANIQRFEMTGNNVLKYIGQKTFYGLATVSATIERSFALFGSKYVRVYVYQNGTAVDGGSQGLEVDTIARSVTTLADVVIQPNDEFSIYVSNETDSDDLVVTQLQVNIS